MVKDPVLVYMYSLFVPAVQSNPTPRKSNKWFCYVQESFIRIVCRPRRVLLFNFTQTSIACV